MIRSLARYALRSLLLSRYGSSRIILGACKGLQMYGANLSNVLSLYEPHLQRIIQCYVPPGSTVLDIGANTGFFTMMMSRQAGPNGKVFAFEAIPSTFVILQQNLRSNALNNAEAFQIAVSDKEAELQFRIPRGGAAMASCYWHQEQQDVDVVNVRSIRLDNFKPLQGQLISFVKIDVEGAEGDVIRGMQEVLSACRPVLFIECSDIGRHVTWSTLKALDYACYDAKEVSREVTEFVEFRHADFLWVPM